MGEAIWGALFVVFGLVVIYQGWRLLQDPVTASEKMRNGPAARFQPAWAVKRWTPNNMRLRAFTMFIGGPALVVFGVLMLTGVIQSG